MNGAEPAELPVEHSTEIELAVNLRTAKAFSIRRLHFSSNILHLQE
jgi:hypothetical protein